MVALFVLLTFLLFIVIDIFVLKAQRKTHPAFEKTAADRSVFSRSSLLIPEGVFISKAHTWVKKNEYGLLKIGIDEFVLKAFGKIIFTKTVDVDSVVKKGDVVLEARSGNKNLKFRAPVNGTVKFVNPDVIGKNISDPYGDDWGILLTPDNFTEERKSLLSKDEIGSWMKEEFKRLKDFLNTHAVKPELVGATMYDGGNVVEGAVSGIAEDNMRDFEKQFLTF